YALMTGIWLNDCLLTATLLRTVRLEGCVSCFASPHAQRGFQIQHENLAVTDFSRARRSGDRPDGIVNTVAGKCDFDLELGEERDGVFRAAIDLGMAFLPAIAPHFGHGHTGNADFGESEAHGIQAVGLNDGGKEFHDPSSFSALSG